jgi:hypothetical protein
MVVGCVFKYMTLFYTFRKKDGPAKPGPDAQKQRGTDQANDNRILHEAYQFLMKKYIPEYVKKKKEEEAAYANASKIDSSISFSHIAK